MNIKDIKPIVEIPDDSLIYLIVISIVSFFVLLIAGYYIWQKITENKHKGAKFSALNNLKNLDFSNSKATAYGFELNASELLNENNKEIFKQLSTDLSKYKYKKQVANLDEALIQKIKDFIYAL